jgi:RNA polymerase sigma factor (sigma-70 family)
VISAVEEPTISGVAETYRGCAADLIRYATVLVGSSDAQDVVSDAMVRVLSRTQEWSLVDNPRAYLFRAVLNQATTHHRSSSRRLRREDRAARLTVVPNAGDAADSLSALHTLDRLSPQQRAIVYLTYWDDLSPTQIAILLDVSEGSIKKQLARAREQIRRTLDV